MTVRLSSAFYGALALIVLFILLTVKLFSHDNQKNVIQDYKYDVLFPLSNDVKSLTAVVYEIKVKLFEESLPGSYENYETFIEENLPHKYQQLSNKIYSTKSKVSEELVFFLIEKVEYEALKIDFEVLNLERDHQRINSVLQSLNQLSTEVSHQIQLADNKKYELGKENATQTLLLVSMIILVSVPLMWRLYFRLRSSVQREKDALAKLELSNRRLQHLAMYDGLTGIANRTLFEERASQLLISGQRNSFQAAILFIDLDLFKNINDSMGHDYGDFVLRQVAKRIHSHVRSTDTVCRLGGDEFVVLLANVDGVENTRIIAEKIRESICVPMHCNEQKINITTSIGGVVFNESQTDLKELLKQADSSLYQVKSSGRNGVRVLQSRTKPLLREINNQ
ncbi:MAG: GGDEF domain-containing protein [Kangiellaceae bacterium]|nr:GGDEF domain-containing protein [Kangiellaceae bacterium]MCW9017028.1 GGDEF domain-containing protein [Kangiellaceae bacterium]